jgi:hypothetical protein
LGNYSRIRKRERWLPLVEEEKRKVAWSGGRGAKRTGGRGKKKVSEWNVADSGGGFSKTRLL